MSERERLKQVVQTIAASAGADGAAAAVGVDPSSQVSARASGAKREMLLLFVGLYYYCCCVHEIL